MCHTAQTVGGIVVGAVLLQHDVTVGAAKPERADARSARHTTLGPDPRASLSVDVEGRGLEFELGVGLGHVQRRWQHLLVERQCRFDHAGGTCRRFGVADL